jgi:serine/threonine-protein kinase RsbW
MFATHQGPCPQGAAEFDPRPEVWHRRTYRAAAEIPALLDEVVAAMEALDYPTEDVFAVRLALEEALVNAVKHGNRGDAAKEARLRYHMDDETVLLNVEDEGEGFDPLAVPDPLAPENLERPSGRGLFLIHKYMTWLEHSARGNAVTMCKHRSE